MHNCFDNFVSLGTLWYLSFPWSSWYTKCLWWLYWMMSPCPLEWWRIIDNKNTYSWPQGQQVLNGPLTRYVTLWDAHAPGMPWTFSPPPILKEIASYRSRHASRHVRDARAVMDVGIANPRWRGNRSWHSRRMRNTQFCVYGKRPMEQGGCHDLSHWLVAAGCQPDTRGPFY